MDRTRRLMAALLVLGGLAYASWLAEFVLPTGLPRLRAYVSELGATGRPHAWFFRSCDLVAGFVLAFWAVSERLLAQPARRSERIACWLLLVFSLGTIADALSPMPCAPSIEAGCEQRIAAGGGISGTIHEVTSVAASAAFLALVWVTVWTLWTRVTRARRHDLAWPVRPLAWVMVALACAYTATTTWTMIEIIRGEFLGAGSHHVVIGLAQRSMLGVMSVWLFTQAWRALRR